MILKTEVWFIIKASVRIVNISLTHLTTVNMSKIEVAEDIKTLLAT